jgi:hypothetical protein
MFALVLPQLADLLRMAREARIGNVTGELDIERGMRVRMACEATLEFIMGLALMTLVAARNDLLLCHSRGMADVAVLAGNLPVSGTICGYVGRGAGVTLHTIAAGELHLYRFLGSHTDRGTEKDRKKQGQTDTGQQRRTS